VNQKSDYFCKYNTTAMKKIMPIIVIALLLVSCTSENDKLLNQFETKVEQYENMATNYNQYNAQQMDSAYNEIDGIMNQLLEAELTEADMSRATQLSIRLQVAIAGIQEQRQQDIEIDLNQILQEIQSEEQQ